MNLPATYFVGKQKEFLEFLRTRFNLFHESNVFFRDLHYGMMAFLRMNGMPNRYASTEELAAEVIGAYENLKILVRIDDRTWMLNYLPFKKPTVKAATPPKPAAKPATQPTKPVPGVTRIATPVMQVGEGAGSTEGAY